ncbi:hypothetical protein QP880_06355 [Dermabacter hominis]|uniref:hypothetical protein n=1 Tax=Dermabacter hominis TaxID=36740 RepID=UPI00316ADC8E|nr:hypothetical protein [Dermabacter hominis]
MCVPLDLRGERGGLTAAKEIGDGPRERDSAVRRVGLQPRLPLPIRAVTVDMSDDGE